MYSDPLSLCRMLTPACISSDLLPLLSLTRFLDRPHSTTNMVLFDDQRRIRKYSSPEEILQAFYTLRLSLYQKRKTFLADRLTEVSCLVSRERNLRCYDYVVPAQALASRHIS